MSHHTSLTRRDLLKHSSALAVSAAIIHADTARAAAKPDWSPNYMLASCMYGTLPLSAILPQVHAVGATTIDIWPKVHGNQREQVAEMGEEKFRAMLETHDVKLGCITQYKLGPFGLQEEMKFAQRFDCGTIVCGGQGPKNLKGSDLKAGVGQFIEKLKPHLEVAEACGVTIAIENHGNNLIESPDSLKWLRDMRPSKHLGIALAPYHLKQDPKLLAALIRELGDSIQVFYAWQHGMGCTTKLPKEQELLQMPGRGRLEFTPLMKALRQIDYAGWTEIFMHPVPRGIPILDTAELVTKEINRSRDYLEKCISS